MIIGVTLDLPLGESTGPHYEPIGLFDPNTGVIYYPECASEGCYQKSDPALESVPIAQDRKTPVWTFGFT